MITYIEANLNLLIEVEKTIKSVTIFSYKLLELIEISSTSFNFWSFITDKKSRKN